SVLDGYLFALFCDLVNAVGDVSHVELEVEAARLGVPQRHARGQVAGEVLRQARAVLDDCAAAIAQRASRPETAPAVAIENLRGTGVSLVEGWDNALARDQWLIASKAAGDGSIEIRARECVLKAAGDAEAVQLFQVQHQLGAAGPGGVEVDGNKDTADRNLMILERVSPGVQVSVEFQTHPGMQFLRTARLP